MPATQAIYQLGYISGPHHRFLPSKKKKIPPRAGKMAQRLMFFQRTKLGSKLPFQFTTSCNSRARRSSALFCPPWVPVLMCTYLQRQTDRQRHTLPHIDVIGLIHVASSRNPRSSSDLRNLLLTLPDTAKWWCVLFPKRKEALLDGI